MSIRRYDLDASEDSATYLADLDRAAWREAADRDWWAEVPARPDHDRSEWDPSDSEGL